MKKTKTKLVIQITSSWCIDAYVRTVRPFDLTSNARRAKGFTHAAAARAYAAKVPSPIASFAPPTTYRLVRIKES